MPNRAILTSVFTFALIALMSCGGSDSPKSSSKKRKKKERAPFAIIRNDDCFTCHSLYDKTIGPAYIDVAKKYNSDDAETVNRLAEKIIEGGGGLWGGALMSKHPLLKKHEVKKVVKWILNLESPKATQFISGPGIKLSDYENQPAENGLQLDIYLKKDLDQSLRSKFPKITEGQKPSYSIKVPIIDFKENDAFQPINERFYLRASGTINITRRGTYIFKLDKSNLAELKIDEMTVISNRPDDVEINLNMEPGKHEVTLEFLGKGQDDVLSWHWISREQEYFHVVPEEVWGE